jgi:DNA-directed RNA polymerase subunit RPC12/RpoP
MESEKTRSLKLIQLRCPQCGHTPWTFGPDIIYYCADCNKGYELRGEKLREVKVEFKRNPGRVQGAKGNLPFWVFEAKLNLMLRETTSAASSVLSEFTNMLLSKSGAFTKKTDTVFYVPAYNTPVDELASLGRRLTVHQPILEDMDPGDFEQVVLGSDDAIKMADYIFLSTEIEKPDTVVRLKYTLDLKSPRLFVINFQ